MEIKLFSGEIAIIDDCDFDLIKDYKWRLQKGTKDHYTAYAVAYKMKNGKKRSVSMHRVIMGVDDPKVLIDHKDRNGLNNKRDNLRIATSSLNQANREPRANSSSKYMGVSWHRSTKIIKGKKYQSASWTAQISKNGKCIHLGSFKCEEDAAMAYDKAAIEQHGEFANLNFKNDAKLAV